MYDCNLNPFDFLESEYLANRSDHVCEIREFVVRNSPQKASSALSEGFGRLKQGTALKFVTLLSPPTSKINIFLIQPKTIPNQREITPL